MQIAIDSEYRSLGRSYLAMQLLFDRFTFDSVLDVGSGMGEHADIFVAKGKRVTCIDYGKTPAISITEESRANREIIVADMMSYDFVQQFDCVWCSHTLEHQPNPNLFLQKIRDAVKEGGVVAITVPPAKHQIVSGHCSIWNGGILLYQMVLAGFDCADAIVVQYDYNISVLVQKRTINVHNQVTYDYGDLVTLRPYFPRGIVFRSNNGADACFDGDIGSIGIAEAA